MTICDEGLRRISAAMIKQAVLDSQLRQIDEAGRLILNGRRMRQQARCWLRSEGREMLAVMFPGIEIPARFTAPQRGDQMELREAA